MSEPDRPTSSDASTDPWQEQDDPEVTRVVRRTPPADGDEGEVTPQVPAEEPDTSDAAARDSAGDLSPEQPQPDHPETPGAEQAPDAPQPDAPQADAPQADAPQADAPQADAPQDHTLGAESDRPDGPRPETPQAAAGAGAGPAPGSGDAPSEPSTSPSDAVTGPQPAVDVGPQAGPASTPAASTPAASTPAASPPGPASPTGPVFPTGAAAPPAGPMGYGSDAEPTSALPPSGADDPQATSYIGAPTVSYPGPGATGAQPFPEAQQQAYSYQQPGYGPGPAAPSGPGPQVIPPPPTASVVLPPVRLPKAESRVALNILGSIVGLILTCGGLALLLIFQPKMRTVDASDLNSVAGNGGVGALSGTIDALALVLTIVGVLLIALAALLAAWASWAAILPGFLLAAVSVWAMVTTGPGSGGDRIANATTWAFDDGQLAALCMNGIGLLIGLLLLLAGLAAVFLRAGVRRTIRQQLESIQS